MFYALRRGKIQLGYALRESRARLGASLRGFLDKVPKPVLYYVLLPLLVVLLVGLLYWLWMAVKIGSVLMFIFALVPPLTLIAAPVGIWSSIFGVPMWVLNWFA